MRLNSLLKITAITLALCAGGSGVAHAQKAKARAVTPAPASQVDVKVEPTVDSDVNVTVVTPSVKVKVKPGATFTPALPAKARVAGNDDDDKPVVSEQTAPADQNVIVSLSVLAGSITVRGSDRREVHVQTNDDKRIELHRKDGTSGNTPATRLTVLFYDSDEEGEGGQAEECGGSTDVKLDVPRGATVILKTQDGDIDVSDVAEVRASTSNGDVSLRRIAKGVEANSMSGDVSLRDAGGHVRLNSISGSVEAVNVSAIDAGDFLQAKSVSGDVTLESIAPARVEARTISGEVNLRGALAPGGHYDFNTTSGDITLMLPESSSFKLDAQVFTSGEINTSFPLKQASKGSTSAEQAAGHLVGTYGSGDATINLNSFSGTLRLLKK
jgi:hypothetical protein